VIRVTAACDAVDRLTTATYEDVFLPNSTTQEVSVAVTYTMPASR